MTDLTTRIARIEELDKKRSQGDWHFVTEIDGNNIGNTDLHTIEIQSASFNKLICNDMRYYSDAPDPEDMEFMAAAPEMLSIIRELKAENDKLRSALIGMLGFWGMDEDRTNPICRITMDNAREALQPKQEVK